MDVFRQRKLGRERRKKEQEATENPDLKNSQYRENQGVIYDTREKKSDKNETFDKGYHNGTSIGMSRQKTTQISLKNPTSRKKNIRQQKKNTNTYLFCQQMI